MRGNNYEKRKNGSGSKFILVLLLLVLFLVCGFFAGYYVTENNLINLTFFGKKDNSSNDNSKNKIEKIDINSRLVQFLYNEVADEFESPFCYAGWRFGSISGDVYSYFEDYNYSKTDEIALNILGKTISIYQEVVMHSFTEGSDGI